MPSPAEIEAHDWTRDDLAFVQQRRIGQAVGSPETVHMALERLLAATGADELMMVTQMFRLDDSLRSIKLVSEMFVSTGARLPGGVQ